MSESTVDSKYSNNTPEIPLRRGKNVKSNHKETSIRVLPSVLGPSFPWKFERLFDPWRNGRNVRLQRNEGSSMRTFIDVYLWFTPVSWSDVSFNLQTQHELLHNHATTTFRRHGLRHFPLENSKRAENERRSSGKISIHSENRQSKRSTRPFLKQKCKFTYHHRAGPCNFNQSEAEALPVACSRVAGEGREGARRSSTQSTPRTRPVRNRCCARKQTKLLIPSSKKPWATA